MPKVLPCPPVILRTRQKFQAIFPALIAGALALHVLPADAQFQDDFSDGDHTTGPTWNGDTELFIVIDENGDHMLRSNSPGAATYHLSTPSELVTNAIWEFFIDLRFATSGSNYVDIHLAAQSEDLSSAPNGYFVRFGDTPDHVVLYRREAGSNVPLIASDDDIVNSSSSNPFRVKITRDGSDNWSLFLDDGATGNFTLIGSAVDGTFNTSSHFGIRIVQSSAASVVNKHFFDDLSAAELPIDTIAPALTGIDVIDNVTIDLHFDEALDPGTAQMTANYSIDNGIGQPMSATLQGPSTVKLELPIAIESGILYTIILSAIEDLSGNALQNITSTFELIVPEAASPGDIVINEVLYDPPVGGSEFVELYNRSEKIIDLNGMWIGRALGSSDEVLVSTAQWLLRPSEFVVLTGNTDALLAHYPQAIADRCIQLSLPALVNSGGTISFFDQQLNVIDLFHYDPDMHFDLVSNSKGYSLERIDPDRGTNDPTNWQTAADLAGRATPGFQNSQHSPAPEPRGEMTIDPAIFSPDNDGYQDVLTITYRFDREGFAGTMIVFDVAGREIRKLMDNRLLGTSGAISWDGLMADGRKARIGPYIVMLEAFDLDGNVERFKKTVTLAHFLDR